MTEVAKRLKHESREAYVEHRKHMSKERIRIRDMGETGVLLYNDLQKAASEYKLTSCFLWKKVLNGRRFTSMKMKKES